MESFFCSKYIGAFRCDNGLLQKAPAVFVSVSYENNCHYEYLLVSTMTPAVRQPNWTSTKWYLKAEYDIELAAPGVLMVHFMEMEDRHYPIELARAFVPEDFDATAVRIPMDDEEIQEELHNAHIRASSLARKLNHSARTAALRYDNIQKQLMELSGLVGSQYSMEKNDPKLTKNVDPDFNYYGWSDEE